MWIAARRAGKDTAWVDPAQLKPETTTKAEVANQGQAQEAAVGHSDSRHTRPRAPVLRSNS